MPPCRAVGTADADVVAAVTGDDEDNLVVSLLSKQEFAVPRVLARVNNPKNEWMFNDMWGVDVSVSTPHLLTALVEEAVTVGSFVRLLSLEGGKARLAEVTLAAGSPAITKELTDLGLPRESTVVAVLRDGHVVVPRGDTVLHEGDEVLGLGHGRRRGRRPTGTGGLTDGRDSVVSNAIASSRSRPPPRSSAHPICESAAARNGSAWSARSRG